MRYGWKRLMSDVVSIFMIFGAAFYLGGLAATIAAAGAIGLFIGVAKDLRSEIEIR